MIKVTIISFSSGRDSATINVIATKALLDMTCFPSLYKALFLFRNSRKIEAPILFHPSAKGLVLNQEIQEVGSLFLDRRINFCSEDILIDGSQNPFQFSLFSFNAEDVRIKAIESISFRHSS